ncbi:MAG: transporter [Candidatus Dadabacteria bacterium]|nr:transporter [Candidatus Dadabacteria bacterium]
MDKAWIGVVVTMIFSIVGVIGDYFLKLASNYDNPMKSGWFYIGFALYASTAFGWVFVMRYLKLATIGVLYSVTIILLLSVVGFVFFKEALSPYEIVGIVLAIASLVLLARFA